jgi:hypothetical protein
MARSVPVRQNVLLNVRLGHLQVGRVPRRGVAGADLVLSLDSHFVDEMQLRVFRVGLLLNVRQLLLDKLAHFFGVLFACLTRRLLRG